VVTFASLGFAVGACLLVFVGIVQLLRLSDLRARRAVRRTTPTPVGSWRPGTARVAGEGITEYGPAGPQTAPVTGGECAWYRVTLERFPTRHAHDIGGDLVLDVASPAWPAFRDRTGQAALDPRMLDIDFQPHPRAGVVTTIDYRPAEPVPLPPLVPPDVIRGLRRDESLRLTEVRLPHAREVYALGRVHGPAATLVRGISVFTSDSREQVLARLQESIVVSRWMVRGFGAAGLVCTAGSTALLYVLG
jgi:hypothetical protein